MFQQSAAVYDALCRHKDYAAACRQLCEIVDRFVPTASTLLDVACGTGRHLEGLRHRFEVEGLDLSAEMLEVAGARCPGVRLHQESFMDFRLDRHYDVVTCLFGSIAYAIDVGALGRAAASMAAHVRPGGLLVVEPWIAPERFAGGRMVFDSADDQELKVARMYVTRREGRLSVFDSTYLVCTRDGVTSFRERQALGLFSDREYRQAFSGAGLEVLDASCSLFGYGLYVCRAVDALGKG